MRSVEGVKAAVMAQPPCGATAYAGLLSVHPKTSDTKMHTKFSAEGWARQILQLTTLMRSLRATERCRRDFVLLLGSLTPLPPPERAALTAAGFILRETPPVKLGVAVIDKLAAFRLTAYRRILFLDADAVALRPLDDAFALPPGFAMVAHPHDMTQGAACGIPVWRRALSALMLLEPSEATYAALLAHTKEKPDLWDAALTKHTPEQTGLACYHYARGALTTLPSWWFYDIGLVWHAPGSHHHLGCRKRAAVPRAECDAAAEHVRANCSWDRVAAHARAVHFKGKQKPMKNTLDGCKRGAAQYSGVASWAMANLTFGDDALDLRWDAGERRCLTHPGRRPAVWQATEKPVARLCCSHVALLKSYWARFYREAAGGGRTTSEAKVS